MKQVSMLSFLVVSLLTLSVQASEFDLICGTEDLVFRDVFIGEDRIVRALHDSEGKQYRLNKYAVVTRTVGGENGTIPREAWTVLSNEQFLFKVLGRDSFAFADLTTGLVFECHTNKIYRAQPALTRTN